MTKMGIIKAITGAIGGGLADSWLEVYEAGQMGDTDVFVPGVLVRKNDSRNTNTKGTDNIISNGSAIHVYDGQFMLLVDNGKVVDYTAEPGMYTVDNSSAPSLFNGQFMDSIKETFQRVKYGGVPSSTQRVFFINLQEIKGIKFGTSNPVGYADAYYGGATMYIKSFGNYSVRVTEPLKFYEQVIPNAAKLSAQKVSFSSVYEQYQSEFLQAFETAINQMSADGQRVDFLRSKSNELSQYMRTCLDEDWNTRRGFEVESVGIQSMTYDDASKTLIAKYSEGAIMSNQAVQQGYMATHVAEGIKGAGENGGGNAVGAFMGMGMGMNMGGNILGGYQQANQQANQQQAQPAPQQPAQATWTCGCGTVNTGKFCQNCGNPKPGKAKCASCGFEVDGAAPKFCPECGKPFNG